MRDTLSTVLAVLLMASCCLLPLLIAAAASTAGGLLTRSTVLVALGIGLALGSVVLAYRRTKARVSTRTARDVQASPGNGRPERGDATCSGFGSKGRFGRTSGQVASRSR
jgi:predicted phage tail protein